MKSKKMFSAPFLPLTWVVGRALPVSCSIINLPCRRLREVLVLPNHSLFFIKTHYWGLILAALGVASLFFR